MNKIGFLVSEKENENRRAIILEDIKKIKNKKYMFFQKGYGNKIGFSDNEIINIGCEVVDKEYIINNCDIICEPKIGDSDALKNIKGKTIFGWIHATQNYTIAQTCIDNKLTVYAWEKMFEKNRHIFYKNNQIAGQAAVLHAMLIYGKSFSNLNVAVLGKGNTSVGAVEILNKLGAKICIYNRNTEKLFKKEIQNYDVIVNCVLWDINRKDHIVNKSDLQKLKQGSLIIDVSCDKNGAIETSNPTTIENPTYIINGIVHYVVDHTPTLLYKDSSNAISKEICKYIDDLVEDENNKVLEESLIIEKGIIIDNEINIFQNRK